MQIKLTQLLSNNNVTGSDVMVTDVSGPLGYVTKQTTVDKVRDYITGSITSLSLNYISSSTAQFDVLSASNVNITNLSASVASFSGSILIYGTAALAQNPTAAYIVYSSSMDKLVAYPGLFISGNVTGSDAKFDNTNTRLVNLTTAVSTVSASIALTDLNHVILVNASSSDLTLTLPTASLSSYRQYIIKKIDSSSNKVIISGSNAELIDGAGGKSINTQYQTITLISDGIDQWFIL